jgi:hemolysin activation/secretion protein
MSHKYETWFAFLTMIAAASTAHAQTHIGNNPLNTLPDVNPPQAQAPHVTVQVAPQPQQQLQELLARHLTPAKFQIEGVKSIPFIDVAKHFAPLVGKDITIGALIQEANTITKMYQDAGYALSFAFVPAQDFANGVVRITAVEGYVATVNVTGRPGATEGKIRAVAAHIAADRPLRRATFERYVQTFGQLPGIVVSANVAPPTNTDGAATLNLDVKRHPFNVSAGLNTNNPGVQGLITATENGLTSLGEQLSISALAPKGPNNTTFLSATGSLPIGSKGLVESVTASHYRSNPIDNPGLPSYVQRTVINDKVGLTTSYPLLLDNQHSLLGSVTMYASHEKDAYQNQINGAYVSTQSQERVVQLQLDYARNLPDQAQRLTVNVAKAFNVLGASASGTTNIPGATSVNPVSTTFVRTGATFTQANQWPYAIGTKFSATGQYSPESLPLTEQISFGAGHYAAGYEPGETSGDSGWGWSAELSRMFSPNYTYMKTITPYVAYDMARVYLHSGQPYPKDLASVSLGLRFTDGKYYSLDLSVAKATGQAPTETSHRSPRLNAAFSYQLY